MSALDKVTRDFGKSFDDFINGLIFKAGDKLGGLISKIGEVSDSVMAGVSGVMSDVANVAGGFSLGSGSYVSKSEPDQCRKLGGNADKEKILAAMDAAPTDKNYADFRTVMAPIVPMEVAQSKGASMGNSFG